MSLFLELQEISRRPSPFERDTASDLWTDEHTSGRMLAFHLDGAVDVSSRRSEFIDRSATWIVSRFGLGAGKSVADRPLRVVYNWLQYFSVEALVSELEAGGFTTDEVLGDVAGGRFDAAAPEFAVVARAR